ncbi:ATP-grasp domain-containing protein [uncultured Microscilla sp.]|uniref:ATP-grasp domain-containing protein n=1 Tax=uncultured Microscilla sp. TaxID=432653 RepID=UPI002612CD1E|nr:ATP-grasp domain-containing protein [uncultured Microscilla sp.]
MLLIFPTEVKYKAEIIGAQRAGFQGAYYNHQHMLSGAMALMLAQVPAYAQPMPAMLRSFVMPPHAYTAIYEHLAEEKNLYLIDTPEQHLEVCSVVNHYDKIKAWCPQTVWIDGEAALDEAKLGAALSAFGKEGKCLMLKDYMRSAKYQREHPYDVADHTDLAQAQAAMVNFKAHHQGVINGGFVFSEYIPDLRVVHDHPFPMTHQPMYEEYRLFFLQHELLLATNYWEEMPDYSHQLTDKELEPFKEVAKTIDSNFFTLDVARRQDGSLVIIELNPGQLAGIDYNRHHEFYQKMREHLQVVAE